MENQNLEQPQVRVKHEPPVEFVLILPRPTFGWPAIKKEEDTKRWVKSVKATKFDAKWRENSKLFQTFFTCPHCQLVMKNQGNLTKHLKACSKINPARVECDFCGKRMQKKFRMRTHMLKHSNERKFGCNKCGCGFKSKQGLLIHSVAICFACDVTFSCKLQLDRHRNESHENVFKCDKCPYETRVKRNLVTHKRTHDKPFACLTCQKNFATNQNLKVHQMQHWHGIYANAPEKTFDCDKCEKTFSTPIYLKSHQSCVHEENEVKCEVCNKICKNRISLGEHRRIHIKVECSICTKMFPKRRMTRHLLKHSVENLFECDLCDYSTKTKSQLKLHIDRKHLLIKLVKDSKCREDFRNFELLEKLQRMHGSSSTSSEKKFKCDKCSKAFVTPIYLSKHIKQVHPDKLLDCQICNKKVRPHRLKSHMKFHFPGNHFECDHCDYRSTLKTDISRHIKCRHRNGALMCNFRCRDTFANFHHLIVHQKIHIGKKLWKCMMCDYQTSFRLNLSAHMSAKKHNALK